MSPTSTTPSQKSTLVAAASVVTLAVVSVSLGGVHEGGIGHVGQDIHGAGIATWALYSTTNSLLSLFLVVGISSLLGLMLGLSSAHRRRTPLLRWLELICALPAFVLTAFWVAKSPSAALVVSSSFVAAQRALQIASLVRHSEQCRLDLASGSLYPVANLEIAAFGRWRSLLWMSAAHTAALLFAEQGALALLGLAAPVPNTWIGTLCAAASGAAHVSPAAITLAVLGTLMVPWAFLARASSQPNPAVTVAPS